VTGPGPVRRFFGRRTAVLPARRRAVEPLGLRALKVREREVEDVLELRDRGGEDVRVAMIGTLWPHPGCPSRHTP